jgi:membrane protein
LSIRKSEAARGAPLSILTQIRHSAVIQVLINVWKAVAADNISLLAAGVAFYALLALFPGLAFIVAMYGLLADPAQVQQQLLNIKGVLPAEAWEAINTQLLELMRQNSRSLSLASIVSLALALINARLGASAMMGALNVVYKRTETRSFAYTNFIAFLFTIAAIAVLAFNIYAVVAVPQVLRALGFVDLSASIIHALRWPALAVLMALSLALIYRYGPDRKDARWRWVSLGSLIATGLWLAGSTLFSWYVAAFNSYDKIYGSFGAVVILLYWLWLTAFAALLGAELDMHIQTELEERK